MAQPFIRVEFVRKAEQGRSIPTLRVSMKILKTVVTLIDLDALGARIGVDTIEHDNKLWLVPEWIDTQDGRWTKPVRIICLSALPHQQSSPNSGADYDLMCPMTKDILSGQIPKETTLDLVIVENPNIEIQRGAGGILH